MKINFKVENKLNWCVNFMMMKLGEMVNGALGAIELTTFWGTVTSIDSGVVHIAGLSSIARIGDRIRIEAMTPSYGEIIAIRNEHALAMPDSSLNGLSPGDRAVLYTNDGVRPCGAWIGATLNAQGAYGDGRITPQGARMMKLDPLGPAITKRKGLGARLNAGLAAFDTFLPICKGQRIGLFAGSGVGKSMLLGSLAKGVEADIVIVALIGERSREVREFVEDCLGEEGKVRSIVFAATCDEPAPSKRRCALMAISAAEYFRDQGLHVLVLFDSLTRFADAHREIALTSGETPSLRAYPPSTFRAIAALAERTGPGAQGSGDITAIFSVLVAGSDMDEPVADMVRGILDGHVVLTREIAERGRFPAIDIRRSVSRSLPKAASEEENAMIADGRKIISAYEEAAPMIRTGLYAHGSDETIDRAIAVWPQLDAFVSKKTKNCAESFEKLKEALATKSGAASDL